MKTKSFQLKVETPCDEDWGQMLSDNDGRFCLLCNKSVIDFTQKSPFEIKSYFLHDKGHTCGRFRQEQLEEIYTITEYSSFHHYKILASLALGLLTIESLNAYSLDGRDFKNEQDSVQLVQLLHKTKQSDSASIIRIEEKRNYSTVLKGIVVDSATNEPLIGVNILIQNTKIGTVTDLDGNFELPIENELPVTVIFSYFGYNEKKMVIAKTTNSIKIKLSKNSNFKNDEVVIISHHFTGKVSSDLVRENNISLKGTIVDSISQKPLMNVRISNKDIEVNTDTLGRFTIVSQNENFPMYLKISYWGYKEKIISVQNGDNELKIELTEQPSIMGAMVKGIEIKSSNCKNLMRNLKPKEIHKPKKHKR